MNKIQIYAIPGTKNWVTTKESQQIGYIDWLVNCYSAQKFQVDGVYPVQVIVFQYEAEDINAAKELIKRIGDNLKLADSWKSDYVYEVWMHENPYWANDAITTLRYNMQKLGFTFDKISNTWLS